MAAENNTLALEDGNQRDNENALDNRVGEYPARIANKFRSGENMSYEIVITKTEIQTVEGGGDWTQVEEQLLTEEDLEQSIYDGVVVKKDEIRLKKVFGYTPKITKSETVVTEIYRQTIPELDLPAVIRAVNGLA